MEPVPASGGQRQVFHPAFDTMARAVGLDSNPQLIAEVKEKTGYDRKSPAPGYPPEVAVAVIDLLARRCFATLPLEDAYEAFGRRAFAGYRATLIGQVVMAALSVVSVERAVRLALRGFQSTANFTRHEVLKPGDQHVVYRTHDSIMPPRYLLGILKELMLASRNPDVKVEITAREPHHVDYSFTW